MPESKELHPVMKEFKDLIEGSTRIYLLCNGMFDEIPKKKPYSNDPTGNKQIRDYQHMLQVLNHLLTTAPHWSTKEEKVGMVGLPINAVLDWPMGTPSGFAFFLDPEVNKMFKKILNVWGEYLQSPESANVLGDEDWCWFGESGCNDLAAVANNAAETQHKFEDMFQCDMNAKHRGFKSWDDFFTRVFKEEVRPVASPEDDNVIANACESQPYNYAYDVKLRDKFWIKEQPYSVIDMLAQDELAPKFEGGTVYQAFLSALSYHRWHAPVSGKFVKGYVVDGTYYSEPLFEGLGEPGKGDIDESGETTSQGYLAQTAARAIMFFEADSPDIGLMAFLGIGMSEVSTCEITVKEGEHVKKGQQIGMFHFGGSTHCLLFRKGVKVEGFPEPSRQKNVPVRSQVAVVKKS
ncbi:hypothetical protein H2203_009014 [Taxawa tesnikishii (nom. ined.)]|nr:hypothetical protein H2203_009014 [Dothideales sp. JES 119]